MAPIIGGKLLAMRVGPGGGFVAGRGAIGGRVAVGLYAVAGGCKARPGLAVGTVPGRAGGIRGVGGVEPAFPGAVPVESKTCNVAWGANAGVVA